MIAKENGKPDLLKQLKRKINWQKVGELYLKDEKIGFPLYYELAKQPDGTKKMQVVAWCDDPKFKMRDIVLSKDTIHSIELVEIGKKVRDMPWHKDGLTWKVNVYKIEVSIDNELLATAGPTVMSAVLRIVPTVGVKVFSYMGIEVECPQVDGLVASSLKDF